MPTPNHPSWEEIFTDKANIPRLMDIVNAAAWVIADFDNGQTNIPHIQNLRHALRGLNPHMVPPELHPDDPRYPGKPVTQDHRLD